MDSFVNHFQSFMLVLIRVLGLMSSAPVFSFATISYPVRMILSFLISLILFPVVAPFLPPVPGNMGNYGLLLAGQILIGIIIGFILTILFAAFQMAGEFFNVQLGFGYTEVLDPVTQQSLPVISTLKNLMAMLLFLAVGGHRYLIQSLAYSFETVQILNFTGKVNDGLMNTFALSVGGMFLVAFQIALPVLGVLLVVTVSEALMGKAAPQLNILQLSFPAKIAIGLSVLIITIPYIIGQMEKGIELSFDRVHLMLSEWPN